MKWPYGARRGTPITLAEMICAAIWRLDGATNALIAQRLRRPIPEVRRMMFGEKA